MFKVLINSVARILKNETAIITSVTLLTAIPVYAQTTTPEVTSTPTSEVKCQMPVLHRNDRQKTASKYVKFLQERLQTYNFTSLKADGFFGKETEDAVIEYQERGNDHDPTISVDGIVGTKTWEALQVTEEQCRDLQKML